MSEYGCTLHYFYHDLSLVQVKCLEKKIIERQNMAFRKMISAHHGDPVKLLEGLDRADEIIGNNDEEVEEMTDHDRSEYNVKTIRT